MSGYLTERLLRSASLQQRLGAAVDDLLQERNVILVSPRRFRDGAILGQIRAGLERLDRQVVTVSAADAGPRSPPDFLAELFRCPQEAFTQPWILKCERYDFPEVILVDELASGGKRVGEWLGFIGCWAASARRVGAGLVPSFAVVVSSEEALLQMPKADLRLSIHWWWSIADPLVTRLLSRVFPVEDDRFQRLWREHLLATLAPWEAELAESLWQCLDSTPDEIVAAVAAIANRSGISREEAQAAIDLAERIQWSEEDSPRAELRSHWLAGLLEQTPEYGIQASILAHAMLGDHEEIRQRIWRAQAGLILPRIDRVRVKLCAHLTRRHGAEWTEWVECRDSVESDAMRRSPIATQIGHLKRVYDLKLRFEKRQYDWVRCAHRIRNELAHVRLVSFQDFRNLERVAQALESELSEESSVSGRSVAA